MLILFDLNINDGFTQVQDARLSGDKKKEKRARTKDGREPEDDLLISQVSRRWLPSHLDPWSFIMLCLP